MRTRNKHITDGWTEETPETMVAVSKTVVNMLSVSLTNKVSIFMNDIENLMQNCM